MSTPEDPYADRLRDVLRSEAERVDPPADGLATIRARIDRRSFAMPWLRPLAAVTGVAVVAAGIGIGVAVTRDSDTHHLVIPPASSGSPSSFPTQVTVSPTPRASATQVTVAVYYLHDTGTSLRLYREFHRVAQDGGPVRTAVEQMLSAPALDSDYSSVWPTGTTVRGISVHGAVATVDFSAQAAGPFNGGSEAAAQSIQQLVYTVTANDPPVHQVQIRIAGKSVHTLWGSVDVSKPQSRGPGWQVLGPVWLLTPTQGQTVTGVLKLTGVATVFEATVSIDITKNGHLVKRTFTTATVGAPGRGDWHKSIVLTPGKYVVEAYEASAKDGSRTFVDSKTVTIR
jgi:sporulation and spore germination protein/immunoglobulin-like protein involved in spore germination